MNGAGKVDYTRKMFRNRPASDPHAVTPSARTLRVELLRLCARIGYSPPLSV